MKRLRHCVSVHLYLQTIRISIYSGIFCTSLLYSIQETSEFDCYLAYVTQGFFIYRLLRTKMAKLTTFFFLLITNREDQIRFYSCTSITIRDVKLEKNVFTEEVSFTFYPQLQVKNVKHQMNTIKMRMTQLGIV